MALALTNRDLLLVVDIQNDFLPGGALAVPDGDAVIPLANRLAATFDGVVATQDWHPPNHGSFAANHPGKKPFEQIMLNGFPQTLWPVHCVQNTKGAELASALDQSRSEEHTSELQSQSNLVCRLLLEKKKK